MQICHKGHKGHKEKVGDLVDNVLLEEHDKVIIRKAAVQRTELHAQDDTFVVLSSSALSTALSQQQIVDAVSASLKVCMVFHLLNTLCVLAVQPNMVFGCSAHLVFLAVLPNMGCVRSNSVLCCSLQWSCKYEWTLACDLRWTGQAAVQSRELGKNHYQDRIERRG